MFSRGPTMTSETLIGIRRRGTYLILFALGIFILGCIIFFPGKMLIYIRSIRLLTAFFVGASLSLCGLLLQTLLRNPLVEPFTLGIAGGASLGATLSFLFPLIPTPILAFLGSLGVSGLVINFSKKTSVTELILVGLMISFFTSSLFTLIIGVLAPTTLSQVVHWMLGGVEGKTWLDVGLLASFSLLVFLFIYGKSHELNALLLGDETAKSLGVEIKKLQWSIFLLTSILTAIVVSISGLIGFVGLLIPHFSRLLFGNDHRQLLITAPLLGGIALLLTDGIFRWI